ncbi:hypothetical protein ASPACDRAFT_38684 [Aspergillus aculeatus ATCC 16872]|uniref:F-box domain-containing protein n=1 Tax=Aspergillus aculeatus (strain ATCC 16872 / CBS 172.66 / WB 5094) TaxID=690307 RepID=A0A1L9X9L1_ASPA1|nr:uncharacterized protein ASPACDRAFT_38684 [Aspergillus aculeatus ATCC 16872]OJK05113.1 hypothetical protein ASPACDRAFT_38684 [Aspergillus aculeatus ATCC 16872]
MSTAQTRALTTVEVLENILLHVDNQSLLTSAQRVCHAWHDLISTPSLQKHLFLIPDWERPQPQRNPLLVQIFPGWFIIHNIDGEYREKIGRDGLNPRWDLTQPDQKASFIRKEASWRRMLVQQPPIRGLISFTRRHSRGGYSIKGLPYIEHDDEDEDEHEDDDLDNDNYGDEDLSPFTVGPPTEPLRMGKLVEEVPRTSFHADVLWDSKDYRLRRDMFHRIRKRDIRMLRSALRRSGMIVLLTETVQCVMGKPPPQIAWRESQRRWWAGDEEPTRRDGAI